MQEQVSAADWEEAQENLHRIEQEVRQVRTVLLLLSEEDIFSRFQRARARIAAAVDARDGSVARVEVSELAEVWKEILSI